MRCFSSAPALLQLWFLCAPLSTLAQINSNRLPPCSVECYNDLISLSGCGATDMTCQCSPKILTANVENNVTDCLGGACSDTDIQAFESAALDTCATYIGSASAVSLFSAFVDPPASTPGAGKSTAAAASTTAILGGAATVSPTTTPPTTTPPTTSPTSDTKPGGKKVNIGLIVGVVIGGLGLVALISAIILFCLSQRKGRALARAPPPQGALPQKTELHSESLQGNPPMMVQNPAVFGVPRGPPIYPQTELGGNQVNEIYGQARYQVPEIQGAQMMRSYPPVELASNWNLALGKPQEPVASPGT